MTTDYELFYFTVGKLKEVLEQFPDEMPVLVNGLGSGYENFYHPFVIKVIHEPENDYHDGEFQLHEKGIEVLLLEKVERYD